jgi:hypothetical protein
MNLKSARVVLRIRRATDILDLAAPFCLGGWRVLLPLTALFGLPAFALCLGARELLAWSWPSVWLLAVALGGVCHAPFTVTCGELLFHHPRDVRLRSILAQLIRRLPAYLATYVISRLIQIVAGLTIMLLPFSTSLLLVVHEAALLEGAGPFSAIGRSRQAVRGQGLSALGIAVALAVLPIAGVLAAEVTGNALVATVLQLGEPFGTLWERGGTPYALAGFFLTIPLSAAARFLKYIDLRTRKEGWDIQLRFMAMAAAAGADGTRTASGHGNDQEAA